MTTLRLEFRRDRRRLPRHTQIDWGQFANADADTMLAQIGDQMRNELEQHVSNVADYVQASTQASSVRVTVDPLQRADESGIESPTGAYLACAVAFVGSSIGERAYPAGGRDGGHVEPAVRVAEFARSLIRAPRQAPPRRCSIFSLQL